MKGEHDHPLETKEPRSTDRANAPTAYLDTAIWIDIAHNRLGDAAIQEFTQAVAARRVKPVLSLTHLMEFARIQDPHNREAVTNCVELSGKERAKVLRRRVGPRNRML